MMVIRLRLSFMKPKPSSITLLQSRQCLADGWITHETPQLQALFWLANYSSLGLVQ